MASPFSLFRKNSKGLMVALVGLSMFAFIIMGNGDPNAEGSGMTMALMAICVVAGIAWGLGHRSGQGTEWAATGALAAALFIAVMWFFSGTAGYVETNAGEISRTEMQDLGQRRRVANDFVRAAYASKNPMPSVEGIPPQFQDLILGGWNRGLQKNLFGYFGADTGPGFERDVVFGFLLSKEADRLGISVSDKAVTEFILEVPGKGRELGRSELAAILRRMRVSESDLYEALKWELRNKQAFQLSAPRSYTTPQEFWDYYKRLTVTQSLAVSAVPVDAFVDSEAEPDEDTLTDLFEKHRASFPNRTPGAPGFVQQPKVRLGYLAIDAASVEKTLSKPTEAEIQEYYDDNKETAYKVRAVPDVGGPVFPPAPGPAVPNPGGDTPTDDPEGTKPDTPKPEGEKPEDAKPDDSPKPDDAKPDEPGDPSDSDDKPADTDTPTDDKPADPPKDTEKPDSEAGTDEPKSDEKDEKPSEGDETSAVERSTPGTLLSVSDDTATSDDDNDPADDAASKDDPAPKSDETPDDPKTDAPKSDEPKGDDESTDAPKADEPKDDDPKSDEPKDDAEATEKAPEYKPLEDVRDDIEKELLRARTETRIEELLKEANEFMLSLHDDYELPLDAEGSLTIRDVNRKMVKFAEDNGVDYVTTPLLTARELSESGDYAIGGAFAADGGTTRRRVLEDLFDGSDHLLAPLQAREALGETRFLVWKLANVPSHLPLLEVMTISPSTELDEVADELGFPERDREKLFPRRGEITEVGAYFAAHFKGEKDTVEKGSSIQVGQFRLTAAEVSGSRATSFQLHEPGVREQVVEAWRLEQARPKAEARATELAKIVRDKPGTAMALVLKDETVTGTEDGQKLDQPVITPEFSWMTRPSTARDGLQMRREPPRLSSVPGVPKAGERFMQTVFEDMDNGEINVVPNADLTIYYVAKVRERSPLDPLDLETNRDEFMSVVRAEGTAGGAYQSIGSNEELQLRSQWAEALERKYEVRFNR